MVIETERLLLREMNGDDFQALYKVLADSEIMQHYPYTFDENRVRNWIERNIERYQILGFGLWAVCLKETGEMIGDCGLTMQLINGQIKPEIGYHIRADKQRKGYAKEALLVFFDYAERVLDLHQLYVYIFSENMVARQLYASCGFREVATLEDWVFFDRKFRSVCLYQRIFEK